MLVHQWDGNTGLTPNGPWLPNSKNRHEEGKLASWRPRCARDNRNRAPLLLVSTVSPGSRDMSNVPLGEIAAMVQTPLRREFMQRRHVLFYAGAVLLTILASQVVSIYGLTTPALADVCCPSGCVPNGYGGCWRSGTNNSCPTISCPRPPSGGGGGGGGSQQYRSPPVLPGCVYLTSLGSRVLDSMTKQCQTDLSANAQFWGCLFEDDAGRAEDQRTGLSCASRQAALANQCQARCKNWASSRTTCSDRNSDWQTAFGDIGGVVYGSARVDLCGPRLPTSIANRVRGRSISSTVRQRPHF
jgi:hypothetical protein